MNSMNTLSAPVKVSRSSFRRAGLGALCMSLTALATGCGAGTEEEAASLSTAEQALGDAPATCAQLKSANPSAGDGEYFLYLNGDVNQPWTAYCHGMASSAPTEFLTLRRTGGSSNFSQYTGGGASPGTTVRTSFTRLRIDPLTLRVNTAVQTFSTSSGQLTHGNERVTRMPYASAMSCDGGPSGRANIDLTGTPFQVAAGQFGTGGFGASGSNTYSADNQRVELAGGGFCGWTSLAGSFNPFNQAGGQLQLQYRSCLSEAGPTLVVNGSTDMTLECGVSTYNEQGAQAFDGCGYAIPVHAFNTGRDASGPGPNAGAEGTYSVSYVAWDGAGRTVSAIRTVQVDDRTAPTLALKGAARVTHTCNTPWTDPGVEALDACYGDVAPEVVRTGEVNAWAEGTYTVTYSLTDSGGNSSAPVTRTVDVVNCPW